MKRNWWRSSRPALHEGLAVGLVLQGGIGLAPFAVPRNPVSFKVTKMGVHCPAHGCAHLRRPGAPALRVEPDDPGLDHHTARTEAAR